PPDLDRVVARPLAKAPEHRFQSAGKFAESLKRLAAGKPPEDADVPPPPTAASAQAAAAAAAASSTGTSSEAEKEFWNEVKDSTDPEDVKLYLEQFPKGMFADAAKKKLAELGS